MSDQIVILGGGFAGVYTAWHLQRLLRGRHDLKITLVSRQNYFLMTPLLFEAGSGILEPRHAVNPIRLLFKTAQFVEAEIEDVDIERKMVRARLAENEPFEIPYDQLVIALGGVTNTAVIRGAEHAMTFKTLGDAILLRNHVIQCFERADVEKDPARKAALLTFVIIGAGFVGLELQGELTEFLFNVKRMYPHVSRNEIRFELLEAGPRVAPEFDDELADYAAKVLRQRGVRIRVNTKVDRIERGRVHLGGGETVETQTVVVATGVVPAPLVGRLPLEKDRKGRIAVEPTMRMKTRPEIWALGDCAAIPDPQGNIYPPLAQHALREAKCLARNIVAALSGRPLQPFLYESKGTLAALGHYKGVGRIYRVRLRGFAAWWVWRSYYLFQMPRWDRRLRVMIDWAVALLFKNDVVQLDLIRGERAPAHDHGQRDTSA